MQHLKTYFTCLCYVWKCRAWGSPGHLCQRFHPIYLIGPIRPRSCSLWDSWNTATECTDSLFSDILYPELLSNRNKKNQACVLILFQAFVPHPFPYWSHPMSHSYLEMTEHCWKIRCLLCWTIHIRAASWVNPAILFFKCVLLWDAAWTVWLFHLSGCLPVLASLRCSCSEA